MAYVCAGKSFKSLGEAEAFAELVFKSKGIVAGIEKKLSKKEKAAVAAKIQSAVYGFVIPMMAIPKSFAALELAVGAGVPAEDLKKIVGGYPGVKESV